LNRLSSGPAASLAQLALNAIASTRPVQWTKSAMVFLPLAFSFNEEWSTGDLGRFGGLLAATVLGAVAFIALSGAVYVINDIFDRERDQLHPTKRRRPIASGSLPVGAAIGLASALLVGSLAGSYLLDTGFGIVASAFLVLNLAYSSYIKNLILLDVMVVGSGYLLRVLAGALVIDVEISPWLYTTIGLGALFIALGKRYSEFKTEEGSSGRQRLVLRNYSEPLLSQMITVTSTATLVAYALYTFSAPNVPANHSMMLTIPFVIFGLFRYLHLINQTTEAESPEMVIIKDPPLVVDLLLWGVTTGAVLALGR